MEEATSFYSTLTPEELTRVEPCEKTTCVIVSGESPPTLQPSLAEDDIMDDARGEKSSLGSPITTKLLDPEDSHNPAVNAADNTVPIRRTVLPIPEPQPKIESNGWDLELSKETEHTRDDDACLIDCIYFVQQCCECVIL